VYLGHGSRSFRSYVGASVCVTRRSAAADFPQHQPAKQVFPSPRLGYLANAFTRILRSVVFVGSLVCPFVNSLPATGCNGKRGVACRRASL